ncbi:MAG TPA: hypothetical protein VGR92_09130 [Steroidobacteraceae bacterium]|nr:hypothetical protein [Steroidobacteraceae bacterium]
MNIQAILPSNHPLAGLAVVLAASAGLAQAAAAGPVTRIFLVEVPAAQDHAFNVGVKAYDKCLRDHGTKQPTIVYDAETGDLSRYLFLEQRDSWAALDTHDPAGMACRDTFTTMVLPHVGQAFSEFSEINPKDSYMPGGDPDPAPIMWVDVYRLNFAQASAFHEAMGQFAAAAAKTHWEGHFAGYDIEGSGQRGISFTLVWPNKSWSDVGHDPNPSAKAMMESVYGKEAAEAMHRKYVAAIAEHWEDAWSYDKDLSLTPAK